jgi:hypothetical protein
MKNKKLLEIFSSIVFLIIAVLFLIAFLFLHYSSEIKYYIKYIDKALCNLWLCKTFDFTD